MFFFNPSFYVVTIVLQAICVIHCIRKGNQNYWIWLIIFLPLIGCIAYVFTEIFTKREMEKVQSGVGAVFNPSRGTRKLEEALRFSDTFANRTALADAYLAAGQTNKAIDLYESSLTGNFTENEYVLSQLVIAYSQKQRYKDIIPVAKKISSLPQFSRSRPHILYAMALGYTGDKEAAEKEFRKMKARFSNYEARYQYGVFLSKENRLEEAREIFTEMLNEASHLSSREKRYNRNWFNLTKGELQKIRDSVSAKV